MFILMISCTSTYTSEGIFEKGRSGLEEIPVKTETNKSKLVFSFGDTVVETLDTINEIQQGRVDLPGRIVYTQRKIFSITRNDTTIHAELLFSYTRNGFNENNTETTILYGRTDQTSFPFTISLIPDELTKVFHGKAKYSNTILSIQGTPYFLERLDSHTTETGFYIRDHKNTLIGFVNTLKPQRILIRNALTPEIYNAVIHTISFLLEYQRYSKYPVNPILIKRE